MLTVDWTTDDPHDTPLERHDPYRSSGRNADESRPVALAAPLVRLRLFLVLLALLPQVVAAAAVAAAEGAVRDDLRGGVGDGSLNGAVTGRRASSTHRARASENGSSAPPGLSAATFVWHRPTSTTGKSLDRCTC